MDRGARRYAIQAVPLSLGSGALLIFFCSPLLALFGNEFAHARVIVSLLVVGHCINAAAGSSAVFLCMTGQERACTAIIACGAMLNGLLNFTLIPRYGAVGAATASAVSLACWNVGAVIWMRTRSGMDTSVLNFLWPPRGMRENRNEVIGLHA